MSVFYGNNTDAAGGNYHNDFFFMLNAAGIPTVELIGLNGSEVINAMQLQKVGFYLNQSSHQVGLIVNGIHHGYVYTLPSKAKNIGFSINSMYQNIDATDVNKEFSIELLTDTTKITQTYPSSSTDICGNTI